jgi:hypothetical protein
MRVPCFKHGKPGVMTIVESRGAVLESWAPENLPAPLRVGGEAAVPPEHSAIRARTLSHEHR